MWKISIIDYILYYFDFDYQSYPIKHFDKMLEQPHELNTKDTMLHHHLVLDSI